MNEDEEKCLRSWGFHFFKMSELLVIIIFVCVQDRFYFQSLRQLVSNAG